MESCCFKYKRNAWSGAIPRVDLPRRTRCVCVTSFLILAVRCAAASDCFIWRMSKSEISSSDPWTWTRTMPSSMFTLSICCRTSFVGSSSRSGILTSIVWKRRLCTGINSQFALRPGGFAGSISTMQNPLMSSCSPKSMVCTLPG